MARVPQSSTATLPTLSYSGEAKAIPAGFFAAFAYLLTPSLLLTTLLVHEFALLWCFLCVLYVSLISFWSMMLFFGIG
ncbi:hypothetical protein F5B19DRAFT_445205 [Rostrohypoxylon terebratum]|nr:hypothetical protein F5B19DRAFT_445205 [Rostrohypoxylon terebratum]